MQYTVHSIIAPGRDSYLVETTERWQMIAMQTGQMIPCMAIQLYRLKFFVKSPDRCMESLSVCIVAGVVRSSLCEGYGLRD